MRDGRAARHKRRLLWDHDRRWNRVTRLGLLLNRRENVNPIVNLFDTRNTGNDGLSNLFEIIRWNLTMKEQDAFVVLARNASGKAKTGFPQSALGHLYCRKSLGCVHWVLSPYPDTPESSDNGSR